MTDFDPGYITDVLGGRDEVDWFSPSPVADGHLAGPADVYLGTADGTVTWGWTVEPVPVDPAGRRFRRFRHPGGLVMLVDADDPETLFLPAAADLHTVSSPTGTLAHAVVVATGMAPGPGDAYSLQKASTGGTSYRLDPAWPLDAVSAALSLWLEIFTGSVVHLTGRRPTPDERAAIDALTTVDGEEPVDEGPLGRDEEIADLLGDVDDVFWFQGDLTWPDRGDHEAFRDRIDVRIRDADGADSWLVSIEPLDDTPGSPRRLRDGGVVVLDPADPTSLRLEWDRIVLAVSVPETGFEPAGVAVEVGAAPGADQWEELRRVRDGHPGAVVIAASAWSEQRVATALAEWAVAWTGSSPAFVYDFDDPVPQAAIDANNTLERAAPLAGSVRTATRQLCTHTDEPESDYEEPLSCGRPATAYFRRDDAMVLVCDDHAPPGEKLTTLLRA